MYKALVVLSVFCASAAQMLLKRGAAEKRPGLRQYLNPWVLGGYAVLAATLVANVYCLSKGVAVKEISAIESLGYLFVPALSRLFFGERITWTKAAAIAIVMVGVLVFLS